MTSKEKAAIRNAIEQCKGIAIPTSTMTITDGKWKQEQVNSITESERLRNSADFRKGWELCHAQFQMYLMDLLIVKERKYRG